MKNFKGNTITDVYKHMLTLPNDKQKGDFFEEQTYYMFKLVIELNANLDKIWMYSDIPPKILEELNFPIKDMGVDLLAIINGEYHTIQCKFRQNPNEVIKWGELGTFFGLSFFGMNDKIKGAFLVTNTYNLCERVMKSNKVRAIYGDFFDDLPNDFFESITKGARN